MSPSLFTQSNLFSHLTSRSLIVGLLLGLLLSPLTHAQQITTVVSGLNGPLCMYQDGSGYFYVGNAFTSNIVKFPPNSTSATAGTIVAGGNGYGSAPNQLGNPTGVYVDGLGYLYVSDGDGFTNNYRVQKFPPNSTSATAGVTVAGGNGQGSDPNQLNGPADLTVDGAGNLYVADYLNYRVQKFPPNSTSATAGTTVAGGNGLGSGPNQLGGPYGIFMDGAGNLYVVDQGNNRVQKFPPNSTSATAGVTVAGGNGYGSGPNQLSFPTGVSMDGAGNLYVLDTDNNRVQQFPPNSTSATAGVTVAGGNGTGSGPNQLNYPFDMSVDGLGNLYVLDGGNNRIQKYSYPPVITSQPVAGSIVCAGTTVTAQVSTTTVIAGPAFTYQWYSSSGPLSGQISPALSLTNVQPGQATNYYVVISSSNGLSTTSSNFTLNVLAKPVASLVASGSLSPANPTVTLTASGGNTYQFGPGATQIGTGPTATVSTPGLYYVNVMGSNGCSDVTSTSVSQAPAPDLIPQLYARPTSLYGPSPVTVVVDVVELNGVASSGLITLKITQDAKLSLSLPPNATSIDDRSVNNSLWQLSGPSGGYYILTTSAVVAAGDKLSVGLVGSFNPGGAIGGLTVSGTLVGGSGGEQRINNNTDVDRMEYFQQ